MQLSNTVSLWPTNLLTDIISDKNLVDQTVKYILENYDLNKAPGEINRENIFFDENFYEFKKQIVEPAFEVWLNSIGKSLSEYNSYSVRGWITGSKTDYSMLTHNHSGSHLSAVFYLFNDAPEAGGELVLFDPRANANRSYLPDWQDQFQPTTIKAMSYSYAVFPSFVYHQTTPFKGKMRIAIPVDLFLKRC